MQIYYKHLRVNQGKLPSPEQDIKVESKLYEGTSFTFEIYKNIENHLAVDNLKKAKPDFPSNINTYSSSDSDSDSNDQEFGFKGQISPGQDEPGSYNSQEYSVPKERDEIDGPEAVNDHFPREAEAVPVIFAKKGLISPPQPPQRPKPSHKLKDPPNSLIEPIESNSGFKGPKKDLWVMLLDDDQLYHSVISLFLKESIDLNFYNLKLNLFAKTSEALEFLHVRRCMSSGSADRYWNC